MLVVNVPSLAIVIMLYYQFPVLFDLAYRTVKGKPDDVKGRTEGSCQIIGYPCKGTILCAIPNLGKASLLYIPYF